MSPGRLSLPDGGIRCLSEGHLVTGDGVRVSLAVDGAHPELVVPVGEETQHVESVVLGVAAGAPRVLFAVKLLNLGILKIGISPTCKVWSDAT